MSGTTSREDPDRRRGSTSSFGCPLHRPSCMSWGVYGRQGPGLALVDDPVQLVGAKRLVQDGPEAGPQGGRSAV